MADIQSIYNRLNSGTAFTPLSVDTFGDWSLEAGDVISVSKDGTTYSTPAMQSGLKWNGGSKVAISSLGDKQREPLSVLSRQQYASGGGRGGYWNTRKAFTDIHQSDTQIELIAREQRTIGGKVTNLESSFTVMSDRIGGSISADGKIIASAAIEAVTGPDGRTLLGVFKVDADQIYLNGNTTLNGIMTIQNGNLRVNSAIAAEHYYLGTGAIPVTIDYGVYDLKIVQSGSSYTLQKQTYADGTWQNIGTFSRAVTSADWTWSNGSAKAHLSPQNQDIYSPAVDTWVKSGSPAYDNTTKLVSQNFIITDEDGQTVTTMNFNISASAAYTAGANEVTINMPVNQIYTTSGSAPGGATEATTLKTRVLQAIADSDKVCFRVDAGPEAKRWYYMQF